MQMNGAGRLYRSSSNNEKITLRKLSNYLFLRFSKTAVKNQGIYELLRSFEGLQSLEEPDFLKRHLRRPTIV